jgi:hypothetical protein
MSDDIDWKALADERGRMLHAASAHIEALEEEVTKLREWLKNIGSEIVLKGDFHITQVGMEDER